VLNGKTRIENHKVQSAPTWEHHKKTYKKAENNQLKKIDEKAKTITEKHRIDDRVETTGQGKTSLP